MARWIRCPCARGSFLVFSVFENWNRRWRCMPRVAFLTPGRAHAESVSGKARLMLVELLRMLRWLSAIFKLHAGLRLLPSKSQLSARRVARGFAGRRTRKQLLFGGISWLAGALVCFAGYKPRGGVSCVAPEVLANVAVEALSERAFSHPVGVTPLSIAWHAQRCGCLDLLRRRLKPLVAV